MKTEKILTTLFAYQRFEKNEKLGKAIDKSLSYTAKELCDDELEVWAAGDPDSKITPKPELKDD